MGSHPGCNMGQPGITNSQWDSSNGVWEHGVSALVRTDPDKLVETHRSYAHAIAAEMCRKLPPNLEREEIQAVAELGLVEAAQSFDPSRGVLFKTFAYYRIRGAILDSLSKIGGLSRTQCQRYRFEQGANEYMKEYSSAPPGRADLAEEYQEIKDLAGSVLSSYMLSVQGAEREVAESLEKSPENLLLDREDQERVRRALAQLPEKNRQVLEDYYFRDLNLQEIGGKLGLSKSWVSRLHARSLEMMRDQLQGKSGQERGAA